MATLIAFGRTLSYVGCSPLMDRGLAEFAARLASNRKVRDRSLRYIPRELVSRPSFTRAPNKAFRPLPYILQNDYRGVHSRNVENSQRVQQRVLAPGPIQQLLEEHLTGRVDHGNWDSQRKIFGKPWIIRGWPARPKSRRDLRVSLDIKRLTDCCDNDVGK
jgi:hypothetical protein